MNETILLEIAREWLNNHTVLGACNNDEGLKPLMEKHYPGGWQTFSNTCKSTKHLGGF